MLLCFCFLFLFWDLIELFMFSSSVRTSLNKTDLSTKNDRNRTIRSLRMTDAYMLRPNLFVQFEDTNLLRGRNDY